MEAQETKETKSKETKEAQETKETKETVYVHFHVDYYQLCPREILNVLLVDPTKSFNVYQLSEKFWKMCRNKQEDTENIKWHIEIQRVQMYCSKTKFETEPNTEPKHGSRVQHHWQLEPGTLCDVSFYLPAATLPVEDEPFQVVFAVYKAEPDTLYPFSFGPTSSRVSDERIAEARADPDIVQVLCCDADAHWGKRRNSSSSQDSTQE